MFASTSTTLPINQTWRDGRSMWSSRPATPVAKPRKPVQSITIGIPPDAELFRTRTQPELYPDWLVTEVHTHRSAYVEALGLDVMDWDCHDCKRAVITACGQGVRCPNCGNAPVYNMATGARL